MPSGGDGNIMTEAGFQTGGFQERERVQTLANPRIVLTKEKGMIALKYNAP